MRVCFLGYFYLDYTAQLCRALAKQNEVKLLVFEGLRALSLDGWRFPDTRRIREIYQPTLGSQVDLAWINPWPWKRDPRGLLGILQAARRIRAYHPDIIHVHEQPDWRLYLLFLLLKDYPWVLTVHDPRPHLGEEALKSQWEMKLLMNLRRKAARLIVHGEVLKEELLASDSGIDGKRVSVIPIGAYDIYLNDTPLDVPASPETILFFGRIFSYKGLDLLIKAQPFVSERFPDARFIIAGEGRDFDTYKTMIQDPKRFELLPRHIPRQEVAALFRRACMVVLPYREATQSAVAAMALAFGRPVVATQVGSIPELIEQGVTGLLVPPNDPSVLAEAICTLLADPERRSQMGRAAFHAAHTRFSWDRVAYLTQQAYERACAMGESD